VKRDHVIIAAAAVAAVVGIVVYLRTRTVAPARSIWSGKLSPAAVVELHAHTGAGHF
jgi:hypothetical protein